MLVERPVGELRLGDHAWFPVDTGDEREQVISAFVRDGLTAGQKIVFIGDAAPGRPAGPRRRPGTTDHLGETGQLCVVPRDEACLTRGRFDPDRLLATFDREIAGGVGEGYRAVRLITDLSWVLGESDGAVLLPAYEDRLAAAITVSTAAMALCQMDRRRYDNGPSAALESTHQVLVSANPLFDDGTLRIRPNFTPPGLRLDGEIDPSHRDVLSRALTAATARNRPVHLDFTGLRFIELGALSLLTAFGTRLPQGRHLILDNLQPDVEAMFSMLGWHRLPGIVRGRERSP